MPSRLDFRSTNDYQTVYPPETETTLSAASSLLRRGDSRPSLNLTVFFGQKESPELPPLMSRVFLFPDPDEYRNEDTQYMPRICHFLRAGPHYIWGSS